ncbi:MAG: WYL domain-containing transcriptional regulator [Erysipelotrichaceae bacterium]|nr:WYL domain-containing transcriptional regulator [Erysipelotrichaceae bacterium]
MAEKKHSNLLMLEILRKYSDENHILSTKELQRLLEASYGIVLERRTIYSNLEILRQAGYKISDVADNGKGYFLEERQFDKGEVLLLCNAIHASHFISQKQSKKLIDTLLETQSRYDAKEFTDKVYMPNPQKTSNKELMYNVEIVSEAIRENKTLQFMYLRYGSDKKLEPRREEPYIVEPRYIVYSDSRAYMISTSPRHEGFTHYRLDKMSNAIVLEEKSRPLPKSMDAYDYARNKLFMYSGEMETVSFRCHEKIMDQMIDIFGPEVNTFSYGSEYFILNVKTSHTGALYLAQQFMEYIELLEPQSLREEFKKHLKDAVRKYQ